MLRKFLRVVLKYKQVSILNLCFSSTDQMEDWKYGSREDNEHSVSCSLPVFHPASKPKIYFLILLNISNIKYTFYSFPS